jgi:stage IV sporulation protein FB
MLRIPGRIPIVIHPFFWVMAFLIGWLNTMSLSGTAIWVVIITISVLVHEYGHALMGLVFSQEAQIELIGFGGLTVRKGPSLKLWQEFLVVLSGPVAGVLLFLCALFLSWGVGQENWVVYSALRIMLYINLVWSFFNLIPVMPLDGGHLLRIVLEGVLGFRGVRISLFLGIVFALAMSAWFFLHQVIMPGALFAMLSFESYRSWRYHYGMTAADRNESIKKIFNEATRDMDAGRYEDAFDGFSKVREGAQRGMFHILATACTAEILKKWGNVKEAMNILVPVKRALPKEFYPLLHSLAAVNRDFATVAEVANETFRLESTAEVAFVNAKASGFTGDVRAAVGWLKCAVREGMNLTLDLLDDEVFEKISDNSEFIDFKRTL